MSDTFQVGDRVRNIRPSRYGGAARARSMMASANCLGCYGSGKVGTQSMIGPTRTCRRCAGTGEEPEAELHYVADFNARMKARE